MRYFPPTQEDKRETPLARMPRSGTPLLAVPPGAPESPVPSPLLHEHQAVLTLHTLLRQTGLGIKIRFLLALTLIALFPALVLVLLLGDPSGREQRASMAQALHVQAQSQAASLNRVLTERTQMVSMLASEPLLAQVVAGTADPVQSALPLQIAQRADASSFAWLVVRSDGTILAEGSTPGHQVGLRLTQTTLVSSPGQLESLVRSASSLSKASPLSLASNDAHLAGGWLALAAPLAHGSQPAPQATLLALFSLEKLTYGLVATSNTVNESAALLLDQQNRIIASSGASVTHFAFSPAPHAVQAVPLDTAEPTLVNADPLTGQSDIVLGASVPAFGGKYLLLAPQAALLVPSSRALFAGRNTPILLLTILLIVVLVATWVALPIVRPIRRATREIGHTTEEVRRLAGDARRIAQDHTTGTTILSGANRKLLNRRQAIIRDEKLVVQICAALWPRLQYIGALARQAGNGQAVEAMQEVQQGVAQIRRLAHATAEGLERDTSLSQLESAMESAREISTQFEEAGTQLEQDAERLEQAARTLL